MSDQWHEEISIRLDEKTAEKIKTIAEAADVSADQAASVICVLALMRLTDIFKEDVKG